MDEAHCSLSRVLAEGFPLSKKLSAVKLDQNAPALSFGGRDVLVSG